MLRKPDLKKKIDGKNTEQSSKKLADSTKPNSSKTKSFIQIQMVRELHGPGALIAMSNK